MATNNVRPRISIPMFESSGDGYRIYREEVILWAAVCGLEKINVGLGLWLELPRSDRSNIKEPILAKGGADKLNSHNGLAMFLAVMDVTFQPTSQCREIKIYNNYYRDMQRRTD